MNEPETRTHYQLKDLYLPPKMVRHEQRAIPWCTFHDRPLGTGAGGGDFNPMDETCAYPPENVPMPEIYDCVISTGGLEHKWWVDV